MNRIPRCRVEGSGLKNKILALIFSCLLIFAITVNVIAGLAPVAPVAPQARIATVAPVATNTVAEQAAATAPVAPSRIAPTAASAPVAPVAPPTTAASTPASPYSMTAPAPSYQYTNSENWVTNAPYGNAVSGFTNRLIFNTSLTNNANQQ